MELTLREISLMCGGDLSANADPDLIVNDVVIDSRKVKARSLFVAIVGESGDGHDHVKSALENGASAALVNLSKKSTFEEKHRCAIYVEDTVEALGLFARNYRKLFNIPVVGITGSNGKTTVKEMLKSICNEEFGEDHVLATTGNLNNHLGMPLTLLKLNPQHKVAIIEMGMNHAGELDYLSKIANPTIAIVNNVMLAHAGFFNDITDIAKAKGEIYNGLVDGGIACINLVIKEHEIWLNNLNEKKDKNIKTVTYGTDASGCYISSGLTDKQINRVDCKDENSFTLVTPSGSAEIHLQILGQHNQDNALTAAVLAINIGCSLKNIVSGLTNYKGYKGRLERKTAFNGALIIDDSYNANPESVKAAILAIAHLPRPHWFIFADLKELGKFAEDAHKDIGIFAYNHVIDKLITYGELAKIAGDAFAKSINDNKTDSANKLTQAHFNTQKDIIDYCMENLPANATLLAKGSNSMKLDVIVDQIQKVCYSSSLPNAETRAAIAEVESGKTIKTTRKSLKKMWE